MSPFSKTSGEAPKFLVPPVSIIYCSDELLCWDTPFTENVYVAAPVFAETVIVSPWQKVFNGSVVVNPIVNSGLTLITITSVPSTSHSLVPGETITFLL